MEDNNDEGYVERKIDLPEHIWEEIDQVARRHGITAQDVVENALECEFKRSSAARGERPAE